MATHGIFSPPAVDRLKNSPIDEVVVTNTLPVHDDALEMPQLTVLSIAPFLADTLHAIFKDESVSSLFMGENV
jgi:ribose-phosphate pyrophosphokinase